MLIINLAFIKNGIPDPDKANSFFSKFIFHNLCNQDEKAPNYLLIEQFCNQYEQSFTWFYSQFCLLGIVIKGTVGL